MIGKLLKKAALSAGELGGVATKTTNRRIGTESANLSFNYRSKPKQGLDLPGKNLLGSYLRKTKQQQVS